MAILVNTVLAALVATVWCVIGIANLGSWRVAAAMHPLSQNYVGFLMTIKTRHAREIAGPKIVTISGSSGLHSLRCEIFTKELDAPCVNGGFPIELTFAQILKFDRTLIKPGDVVLMPLEYVMYFSPFFAGYSADTGWLSAVSRLSIPELFRIDFDYLLTSLSENLLVMAGDTAFTSSYFDPGSFTREGDRRYHTRKLAQQFADKRAHEIFWTRDSYPRSDPISVVRQHLNEFFSWAKQNNVLVVGTVQPEYDDWDVPRKWLDTIPPIFQDAGFPFIVLQNQSRYPRNCFWDASDHLNEECQILHTERISGRLRHILVERSHSF